MYKCSKCGLGVIVEGEKKIKACKCEASIIASMESTVTSKGGVKA